MVIKFQKIAASVVTLMTLLAITPMEAHAEWKLDSKGWWYTEGNTWATGWKYINEKWYYFYSDGYMAHDTTIDGFYVNSSGAWITDLGQYVSNNNSQASTVNNVKDARIKLTFNNEEVIIKLYDNPTSRDFLTLLPLTTTLEDFAGAEKIGMLSKRLSTEDAPTGSDPSVRDFAYYSPWGNIAIYYKDAGYANGVIKLGKIESGIEKLGNANGDVSVKIEKIN